MALWPPSLINSDEISESVGAHKILEWQCFQKDKNSCELSLVESTVFMISCTLKSQNQKRPPNSQISPVDCLKVYLVRLLKFLEKCSDQREVSQNSNHSSFLICCIGQASIDHFVVDLFEICLNIS